MQNIIVFPEKLTLEREVDELRVRLVHLVEKRDELIWVAGRNLEIMWSQEFGALEAHLYLLDIDVARLRRKLHLIQERLNRCEKVDLAELERKLDQEFEAYKKELSEFLEKLSTTLELAGQLEPLTKEETVRFKQLYRKTIRKTHPDLNPDASPREIELFHLAVAAYKRGDLAGLEAVAAMAMSAEDLADVREQTAAHLLREKTRLVKLIDKIEAEISRIRSEFPFTWQGILSDADKIEKHRKELEQRILEIEREKARLEALIHERLRT